MTTARHAVTAVGRAYVSVVTIERATAPARAADLALLTDRTHVSVLTWIPDIEGLVERTRNAGPGAQLCQVAPVDLRATDGRGRLESILRTERVRSSAILLRIAGVEDSAAPDSRRLERIPRTRRVDPVAGLR